MPEYVSSAQAETTLSLGTKILARGSSAIQWQFSSPLALRQPASSQGASASFDELRFWFRSDRASGGSQNRPFYLSFEVAGGGSTWQRLLPVQQPNVWELHRLWLGDMPDDLRSAVSSFTLRGLSSSNGDLSFQAVIGDIIATTPEPIQDVDSALLKALDERFRTVATGTATAAAVRALVELPENPGTRALPYILIIPWSVQPQKELGGSCELIDNYTENGVSYVRPPLSTVQVDYAIDVFAETRSQKIRLLEGVLNYFNRHPYLTVNGERIEVLSFVPPPEELSRFTTPGRTPLFYRLTVQVETGDRQRQERAVPFINVNPQRSSTELDRSDPELARI
ncbi:hypothetical protein C8255_06050 [filamentous cyanobacterium CCP3]|nr:hypothetical protein C8255_06050 [filamentous cyanobacterium CCP3]